MSDRTFCFWVSALGLLGLFFASLPADAGSQTIRAGMTCTYTPPGDAPQAYAVEVVSTFEASTTSEGQPWLWVKRPGQARYQSVMVPPSTLSGCRS